jgi:hypothetical protein
MLRVRQLLLVTLIVATGATVTSVTTTISETRPTPNGDVLNGKGKNYVFVVSRGTGNSVIRGFDPNQGHKIRLAGFGITRFSAVAKSMREVDGNVLIELPGAQQLWVTDTKATDLTENVFQLELDRTGLVKTFGDEFDKLSWDAEGAQGFEQEKGTWRTSYDHGAPYWLSSRTLTGSGEQEIYADPALKGTADKPLGLNPFRVADGVLEITASPVPDSIRALIWDRPYISGVITTRGSFSQLYGVFEMRARLPKGRGLWPAFWLMPADGSWPPELDVMEVLGHETTVLYTSWHSKETGSHTSETIATPVPDLSADFHVYSLEWNKDEIKWYFDGVEVSRRSTPADMHQPMFIRANLAVGGGWPKNPDASTHFPAVFAIDWIRVYRRE